jgi:hypothetical protein
LAIAPVQAITNGVSVPNPIQTLIDDCPTTAGFQETDAECTIPDPNQSTSPPTDVCPDDEGVQTDESQCTVPDPNQSTSPPTDVCPNDEGVQTNVEECDPPDECDVVLEYASTNEVDPCLETGTITITKYANFDSNDTWDFNIDDEENDAVDIDVSNLSAGETSDPQTVPAGTYEVSEDQLDGWEVNYAFCGTYGGNGSWSGDSITGISVGDGENVSCVFYNNTTNGSIQIKKVTDVETSQTFDFTIESQGEDETSENVNDLGAGQTSDPVVVPAGTYDVGELVPEGWDLGLATCTKPPREQQPSFAPIEGGTNTGSQDGNTVFSVDVPAGVTVTCTFNNSKEEVPDPEPTESPRDVCTNLPGIQEAVPPGMLPNGLGDCFVPPTPIDICPNLDGVQTEVPAGTGLDEHGDCVPPPPDSCPNLDGTQDAIPAGNIVDSQGNCVGAASITLVNAIGKGSDSTQTFTFNFRQDPPSFVAYVADLTTDGTVELGAGESDTVGGLLPGNYSLSEDVKDGWDPPSIDCGGAEVTTGEASVQVHLGVASHVTCEFTNSEKDTVLGERIHNGPKKPVVRPALVRSGVLPFTGEEVLPFIYVALMLFASGACLVARRPRGRHSMVSNSESYRSDW